MIEKKITDLTNAIERLIVTLDKSQTTPDVKHSEKSECFKTDADPKPIVVIPAVEINAPSVNINALQSRCLELTRIDRNNNGKIRAIIASYGGTVLKDVPADKLGELAAKLEELV